MSSGPPAGPPERRPEDSPLEEGQLAPTWVEQFQRWLADSRQAGIVEPEAMVLATADAAAHPSARTVLLKGCDEEGFVFFTNLGSPKALELADNPSAALVFPWYPLRRQVIVTGAVAPIEARASDAYFASRAYGSQIGAYASRQSGVIAGRGVLDHARAAAEAAFPAGKAVPRPVWWGGLRLAPDSVEFWQGRPDRLHDRLRFRRPARDGDWIVERLSP